MRVKLKVAATVPVVWDGKTVRHDWMPAGSEVDLPEEDFHPDVHEDLTPAPEREPETEPEVESEPELDTETKPSEEI